MDALRRGRASLEKAARPNTRRIRRTDQEFARCRPAPPSTRRDPFEASATDAVLLESSQAQRTADVCVPPARSAGHRAAGTNRAGAEPPPAAPIPALEVPARPGLHRRRQRPAAAATETHLRDLYDALIAPVRDRLQARHIVVVPHDVLHFLPFHALFDGQRYLIDEFSVSLAPSASVYRLCWAKRPRAGGDALVMGVPDLATPFIADEVASVADVLPEQPCPDGRRRDERRSCGCTARGAASSTSRRTESSGVTTRCSRRSVSATANSARTRLLPAAAARRSS